jgi:hypothetical protein
MPRRPRSVDVYLVDIVDGPQGIGEDSGTAERSCQDVGKTGVVGAVGIRPHEPGVTYLVARDQAGLFRPLDFAVDGRMRRAGPLGELGEAEFEVGIAASRRELMRNMSQAVRELATA